MITSPASSKRVLGTALVVTGGVGFLAGIERGESLPTARFLIGVGVAFTICSVMVDLGSPLGGAFAVLIMLSALIYNGEDALNVLRSRGGPAPKKRGGKKRKKRGGNAALQGSNTIDPLEGN